MEILDITGEFTPEEATKKAQVGDRNRILKYSYHWDDGRVEGAKKISRARCSSETVLITRATVQVGWPLWAGTLGQQQDRFTS